MEDYSVDEIMCVCIARCVVDGEVLAQGINTPLVMAGYILAKLTHAPNVRFASAIAQGISMEWAPLGVGRAEEAWLERSLTHVGFATATAELLPKYNPKEFFRPGQVDSVGNFNNIAFGTDINRPRFRLPGSGGIPDVTVHSEHVYLYVPRHSRVTFVETCDVVSGLGHVAHRKRGSGPVACITDLGVFDWQKGRMRLVSHHPGVTIDRVQKKTGFELEFAPNLAETIPPTQDELRLLRDVIDPLGVRQLETLSGTKRKEHLRNILQAEDCW